MTFWEPLSFLLYIMNLIEDFQEHMYRCDQTHLFCVDSSEILEELRFRGGRHGGLQVRDIGIAELILLYERHAVCETGEYRVLPFEGVLAEV